MVHHFFFFEVQVKQPFALIVIRKTNPNFISVFRKERYFSAEI